MPINPCDAYRDEKPLATLTLLETGTLQAQERVQLATWLFGQAQTVLKEGGQFAKRYSAHFYRRMLRPPTRKQIAKELSTYKDEPTTRKG